MQDLDTQLLVAHDTQDYDALVRLYTQAADEKEAVNDIEATCFFLTQAFIFALDSGNPQMVDLNQRLVTYGREVPL